MLTKCVFFLAGAIAAANIAFFILLFYAPVSERILEQKVTNVYNYHYHYYNVPREGDATGQPGDKPGNG